MPYVNIALAISFLDGSSIIGRKTVLPTWVNKKHHIVKSRYVDGKGHIESVLVSSDSEYTGCGDAAGAAKERKAKSKEQSKQLRAHSIWNSCHD